MSSEKPFGNSSPEIIDSLPKPPRFPERINSEKWFAALTILVILVLIVFSTKPSSRQKNTLNDDWQASLESILGAELEKSDNIASVYSVILEGDGAVRAFYAPGITLSDTVVSVEALKGECINQGPVQVPINLMLMMKDGYSTSPSLEIPTRHGHIWPMRMADPDILDYERMTSDTVITLKTGLARSSRYVINVLSNAYYNDSPGRLYYALFELFPEADPGLPAGFPTIRSEYEALQAVATGYSFRINPLDMAFAYHAVASGGRSKPPYLRLDDAEIEIEVCPTSIADTLMTILDIKNEPDDCNYVYFKNYPCGVYGKSATVRVYDYQWSDEDWTYAQIFVGSVLREGKAVTVYVMVQYSDNQALYEQKAVTLSKSIFEVVCSG